MTYVPSSFGPKIMMRFLPPAAGDMRFLTPTRPVLYFWWKSSASMYQLPTDTFCTGAYFFDRRSRPFPRIRTPSISFCRLLSDSPSIRHVANFKRAQCLGDEREAFGPIVGVARRRLFDRSRHRIAE